MAHQRVRWSSEMEERLVGMWQQRECLYNVSCKAYHNRNDRERSWAELAVCLVISVEEVKMRATSLRTQYSKILKVNPSGSGEKTLTNKQRWIMKSLMFLKKYVTQRATESTLYQSTKDAMAAEREPLSDPDDDVSQMSEETSVEEQSSLHNDDDFSPPVSPSRPAKRQKKSQSADDIEMEKLKILQQMAAAFGAGKSRSGAFSDSNFGAQVAEELRLIKNHLIKTRVKRKIMNDLYEAQEKDAMDAQPSTSYQQPPPTYPVPPSVHMPKTHPPPLHTHTIPQAPPLPLTGHNQYQLQNNDQIHSFKFKMEDDG
uniref:MADF domain-containing protein n=1 Tax=Nothobranchius korthausae TaxID=1143690 RepID=A0A1A8H8R2_9TELE